MKQIVLLVVAMMFIIGSMGAYTGTGVFTRITNIDQITEGYYVISFIGTTAPGSQLPPGFPPGVSCVIAFDKTRYAVANQGQFHASFIHPDTVDPAGTQFINPSVDIVWYIQPTGTGTQVYIRENALPTSGYLRSDTNANSGLRFHNHVSYTTPVDPVESNLTRWIPTARGALITFQNVQNTSRHLKRGASIQPDRLFTAALTAEFDLTLWKLEEPDAPLSIFLSNFTATVLNTDGNQSVALNWQTATESNMSGFVVLRGDTSDRNTARTISGLISATNTAMPSSYSFIDSEVEAGTSYYYWIEMRGIDGSSRMSTAMPTIIPEIDELIFPEFTAISNAYPNPMRIGSGVNFDVEVKENEVASLQIFNARGQIVYEVSDIQQGSRTVRWDGRDKNNRDVASGVYFYRLSSPSTHSVQRLVIIR